MRNVQSHIDRAFRVDQNTLLFSTENFEMRFFFGTFKMDFKLSTSLKCFAVSGFHPLPAKQDAEDLPLNSALHNLLSSALQALSLGSCQSQCKEWSLQEAVWWEEGYCKPKAVVSKFLIRNSEGSVCNFTIVCGAQWAPFHLVCETPERLCWYFGCAWGTGDHKVGLQGFRFPISAMGKECLSVKSLPGS